MKKCNLVRYEEIMERLHEFASKLNIDLLMLQLKDVAYILHVSLRTVQRRCRAGKLIYMRTERAVRIPITELVRYIEDNLVVAK
ncbi:MAG: helix-turn-helix domain-containing protein [Negativicutes bacterium]